LANQDGGYINQNDTHITLAQARSWRGGKKCKRLSPASDFCQSASFSNQQGGIAVILCQCDVCDVVTEIDPYQYPSNCSSCHAPGLKRITADSFIKLQDKATSLGDAEERLVGEVKDLKARLHAYQKIVELETHESKVGRKGKKAEEASFSERQLEAMQFSLAPLTLKLVKSMSKINLITIILTREAFLYQKAREFDDQLKHNDRVIFKEQLKEIERLRNLLLDESPLYQEVRKLQLKIKQAQEAKQEAEGMWLLAKQVNKLPNIRGKD